jgi:hypothetical protein
LRARDSDKGCTGIGGVGDVGVKATPHAKDDLTGVGSPTLLETYGFQGPELADVLASREMLQKSAGGVWSAETSGISVSRVETDLA